MNPEKRFASLGLRRTRYYFSNNGFGLGAAAVLQGGHLGDAGGRHAGFLFKMLILSLFASDTFLFLDCTNMHMCVLQHIVYVIIRLLSPFTLESGFLVGESFQLVVGSDLL